MEQLNKYIENTDGANSPNVFPIKIGNRSRLKIANIVNAIMNANGPLMSPIPNEAITVAKITAMSHNQHGTLLRAFDIFSSCNARRTALVSTYRASKVPNELLAIPL